MQTGNAPGRRPSLAQVLDYYTSADFCQFLFDTCRTRPVALVIPRKRHWEIRWNEDILMAGDKTTLCEHVVAKIREALPEVRPDDRPAYYPSFHQLLGEWPEDASLALPRKNKAPRGRIQDCALEADLATWQESFGDLLPILDLMDRHGVRYQLRFSGHRSLHLVLPGELVPRPYRGRGASRLARRLIRWSRGRAHHLHLIARMPYSLNEDTGLVCLPIERGTLPSFRPWQASLHLVHIGDARKEPIAEDDRDRMIAFLDALSASESKGKAPSRRAFRAPDKQEILSAYQGRLGDLEGTSATATAWTLLTRGHEIPGPVLMAGLTCPEPDARWLAVEAFFLHGSSLSREICLKLLEQEDEYVRASALDVLSRFEEEACECLVEILCHPEGYPTVLATAAHLLAQSVSLRTKVLDAMVRYPDRSRDVFFATACSLGAIAGNWRSAFRLLEPVRDAPDLTDRDRARLAALDIMGTLGGWDPEIGWHPKEEAQKQRALAALGQDVADLLLLATASSSGLFRNGIAAALALLADPRAVDVLIPYLDDGFLDMNKKAASGLIRIGEPAVAPLIVAAASDQPHVRQQAILCLGHIGAAKAKPTVLQALDDDEPEVRRQAIKALKRMAAAEDIERLKRALREERWDNGLWATQTVQALGDEGLRALLEMALAEQNPAAAYSIALRGDPRGREILVAWLSQDGAQREDAVEFLRELRDERCVPQLAQELETASGERGMFLALELGEIGGQAASTALVEALTAENRLTRRGAVRALGKLRDPAYAEPLIRRLVEDPDFKVAQLATHALTEIGAAAQESLTRALSENRIADKNRRNMAKRVLRQLNSLGAVSNYPEGLLPFTS